MINYGYLKAEWPGRKNRVWGRPLGHHLFFKPEGDTFRVVTAWTNWGARPDGKFGVLPPETWTAETAAIVYPDRIEVTSNHAATWFLKKCFGGLRPRAPNSKKTDGKDWLTGNLRMVGHGHLPCVIREGVFTFTPPKVRTVDEAKRKELNATIRKLRHATKVRADLGALHGNAKSPTWGQYGAIREKAAEVVTGAREEDINTFKPLADGLDFVQKTFQGQRKLETLSSAFNPYINRYREAIKRKLKVVEYK